MPKNKAAVGLRRSTRQTVRALSVEPTPRGPLKRTKRQSEDNSSAPVNGISEVENGLEDGESPTKKHHFDNEEADGNSDDENEMEFQESAQKVGKNEELEMDRSNETGLPKFSKAGALGDMNLSPLVVLGERCRMSHPPKEGSKWTKPNKEIKEPASTAKSSCQMKPADRRECVAIRSIADYQDTMRTKARSADVPKSNHFVRSPCPDSEKTYRQRENNIPKLKEPARSIKQEATKKTAEAKRSSGNSCRGFMWYFWRLVFLLLLSSATLLAYTIIPGFHKSAGGGGHPSRKVKPEVFLEHLQHLRTQFPNQQPELWKRTQIHLEKHLKTAHPTEPVSLIFTAGLRAERTMWCLAHGVASAYSSVLNASVLHLDGKSKSSQDSGDVMLDIDKQLQAAFEGDKPAAVIHRLEELPPDSTLIFYRYCDHENAAYKNVFMLFTVLLPQDEIRAELSLKEVEEMVHDYVEKKLVQDNPAGSAMNIDKFSGLWSRISHLVLPVVPEEMEQRGCP